VTDLKLGDSAVTSADEEIAVSEELHAVNTLGEEPVAGSNSLEEAAWEVNLDDITGEGTQVGAGVIGSNADALVDSLDLSHGKVLEEDLLLDVVDVPDADSVVVDGDKVLVGVVEEGNFVSDVHTNGMATDGFTRLSLPDYELVVILTAKRSQVLFVGGKGETLDQHLMHFESVHHVEVVEVPNDDISLLQTRIHTD